MCCMRLIPADLSSATHCPTPSSHRSLDMQPKDLTSRCNQHKQSLMKTKYLKLAIQHISLLATLLFVVCPAAAAQDSNRPPYNYDDEMLCRFVLDGVSTPPPRGADPSEIANNTGVGGYYWATQYNDYGLPVRQIWFYPWTSFSDDARQDKGVAVFFERFESSHGAEWIAGRAYEVGFVDGLPSDVCVTTPSNRGPCPLAPTRACEDLYPTGKVRHSSVTPLHWFTMLPHDCKVLRERILNSPHDSPPGCE